MALPNQLLAALDDLGDKSLVDQCVVNIHIAMTLPHGLAHYLYIYRRSDCLTARVDEESVLRIAGIVPEPFVNALPERELGDLFEVFFLGGELGAGGYLQEDLKDDKYLDSMSDEIDEDTDQAMFDSMSDSVSDIVFGQEGLKLFTYHFDSVGQRLAYKVIDETILMLLQEATWLSRKPVQIYLLPE